jgi:MFS family permease
VVVGAIGIVAAIVVPLVLTSVQRSAHASQEAPEVKPEVAVKQGARGFPILLAIGIADSATRMGFMTFLPFILATKGASLTTSGLALTLTFAGGAFGKLACGLLGARFGVTWTVVVTKAAAAMLIMTLLALPLIAVLVILPLLGTMLNGTSSAIYGSVPEFTTPKDRARTFGIFYTATIGSGAIAPVFFGFLSDHVGLSPMIVGIAATALVTLPLALLLSYLAKIDKDRFAS